MPAPFIVYFARLDAYERIVEESSNSPGRETGGILVGRMFHLHQGLVLMVVAASGPGTNADRRAHTYAPDTYERQRELEAWRDHYAAYAVDYVGEWHKHPPGHHKPSSGDTLQVIEILSDNSYRLPDGIFTPLVTIENGVFMLHSHFYPREQKRPVAVKHEIVDGDIRDLLGKLAALEQADQQGKGRTPRGRWGVDPEALRTARVESGLHIPDAQVITPDDLPASAEVIDAQGYIPPPRPTNPAPPIVMPEVEIPPFPAPPNPADVPPAPPLPGRAERERSELEQFCAARGAKLKSYQRDDGGTWYEMDFAAPLPVDLRQIVPNEARSTAEGNISPPQIDNTTAIASIRIDPGAEFPNQPPEVVILLNDGHRLRVHTEQLFPGGWRSHQRLREVLRATLDVLQQPRPSQQFGTLLEFHGRLIVRQMEAVTRSVADILADINRNYSFQRHDVIESLDPPQQGA